MIDGKGQRRALHTTLVEVMGNIVNDLLAEPDKEGKQPQLKVRNSELVGAHTEKIFSSRGLTATIEKAMSRRSTLTRIV